MNKINFKSRTVTKEQADEFDSLRQKLLKHMVTYTQWFTDEADEGCEELVDCAQGTWELVGQKKNDTKNEITTTFKMNERIQNALCVGSSVVKMCTLVKNKRKDPWVEDVKLEKELNDIAIKVVEKNLKSTFLGDEESTNSFVDVETRTFIRVWHSRKEGRRFSLSAKALTEARHELMLSNCFAVPYTISLVYQGRYITVTWIPPLVDINPIKYTSNSIIGTVESYWRAALGTAASDKRIPLYTGADGRYYAIGAKEVLAQRVPSDNVLGNSHFQRHEMASYDLIYGKNSAEDRIISAMSRCAKALAFWVANPEQDEVVISEEDNSSKLTTDKLIYIMKRCGVNQQNLGELREVVKEEFDVQMKDDTLVQEDLPTVLHIIDELILMRSVKAMIEWQVFYATHDTVKGKEHNIKEVVIEAANIILCPLVDTSAFIDLVVTPILLRKFKLDQSFSLSSVIEKIDLGKIISFVCKANSLVYDYSKQKVVNYGSPTIVTNSMRSILGEVRSFVTARIDDMSDDFYTIACDSTANVDTRNAASLLAIFQLARSASNRLIPTLDTVIDGVYTLHSNFVNSACKDTSAACHIVLMSAFLFGIIRIKFRELVSSEFAALYHIPLNACDSLYLCGRCHSLYKTSKVYDIPFDVPERRGLLRAWAGGIVEGFTSYANCDKHVHCRKGAREFIEFSSFPIQIDEVLKLSENEEMYRSVPTAMCICYFDEKGLGHVKERQYLPLTAQVSILTMCKFFSQTFGEGYIDLDIVFGLACMIIIQMPCVIALSMSTALQAANKLSLVSGVDDFVSQLEDAQGRMMDLSEAQALNISIYQMGIGNEGLLYNAEYELRCVGGNGDQIGEIAVVFADVIRAYIDYLPEFTECGLSGVMAFAGVVDTTSFMSQSLSLSLAGQSKVRKTILDFIDDEDYKDFQVSVKEILSTESSSNISGEGEYIRPRKRRQTLDYREVSRSSEVGSVSFLEEITKSQAWEAAQRYIPTDSVKRNELFDKFDKKKRGKLTLKETTDGTHEFLHLDDVEDLDGVITLAFKAAKAAKTDTNADPTTIDREEFQVFLTYLRDHCELANVIDTDAEGKVTREEFEKTAIPLLEEWGISAGEASNAFERLEDADGNVKEPEIAAILLPMKANMMAAEMKRDRAAKADLAVKIPSPPSHSLVLKEDEDEDIDFSPYVLSGAVSESRGASRNSIRVGICRLWDRSLITVAIDKAHDANEIKAAHRAKRQRLLSCFGMNGISSRRSSCDSRLLLRPPSASEKSGCVDTIDSKIGRNGDLEESQCTVTNNSRDQESSDVPANISGRTSLLMLLASQRPLLKKAASVVTHNGGGALRRYTSLNDSHQHNTHQFILDDHHFNLSAYAAARCLLVRPEIADQVTNFCLGSHIIAMCASDCLKERCQLRAIASDIDDPLNTLIEEAFSPITGKTCANGGAMMYDRISLQRSSNGVKPLLKKVRECVVRGVRKILCFIDGLAAIGEHHAHLPGKVLAKMLHSHLISCGVSLNDFAHMLPTNPSTPWGGRRIMLVCMGIASKRKDDQEEIAAPHKDPHLIGESGRRVFSSVSKHGNTDMGSFSHRSVVVPMSLARDEASSRIAIERERNEFIELSKSRLKAALSFSHVHRVVNLRERQSHYDSTALVPKPPTGLCARTEDEHLHQGRGRYFNRLQRAPPRADFRNESINVDAKGGTSVVVNLYINPTIYQTMPPALEDQRTCDSFSINSVN